MVVLFSFPMAPSSLLLTQQVISMAFSFSSLFGYIFEVNHLLLIYGLNN